MLRNGLTGALILNEGATAPTLKPAGMQHLVANLDGARIEHVQYEGRPHWAVPMVMLTEGVHAGSQGPLLYQNEELAKTPESWNHKPVVVYHPVINGVGVSACDPDILSNRKVGMIFNAGFGENKLRAEAWLDPARLEVVDNRIKEALEKGEMVELSTGLFADHDPSEGEWNSTPYSATVHNIRPDHLAILPDQTGACSIADGAGLLRNEASFDTNRGLIWSALDNAFPSLGNDVSGPWVEEVFQTFFIYHRDGKLWKQSYSHTDAEVTFNGDSSEVVRVTEFRTMSGEFVGNKKESKVDKKAFVLALIANSLTQWEDSDTTYLLSLDENQLKKFEPVAPVVNADPKPTPAVPVTAPTAPIVNADPAPKDPKTMDANEYIANAPDSIRDMLASGLRAHESNKTRLVAVITGNEKNLFTAEQLNAMSLEQLEMIANLAVQPVANQPIDRSIPTFAGMADALAPAPVGNADAMPEPLGAPTMSDLVDVK